MTVTLARTFDSDTDARLTADLLEFVDAIDRYTVVGSTVFVQVYPDSGIAETLARGRFEPSEWPR